MGGHGSGRTPIDFGRAKPLAEDCVRLCVYELQKAGVLVDGLSGVLQWDGNSAGFAYKDNRLLLVYRTGGQEIRQCIRLSTIPLYWKHGTSRRCFLCPSCEHKVYTLFVAPRKLYYACRECCNLCYELQVHHNANLLYRYWKAIAEDRRYERLYDKSKRLTVLSLSLPWH